MSRYRPVPVPTSRSRKGRACAAAVAKTSLTRPTAARSASRTLRYLEDMSPKWRFVPPRRASMSATGGSSIVRARLSAMGIDRLSLNAGPNRDVGRDRVRPDDRVPTVHYSRRTVNTPRRVRWAERSGARELNETGRGPRPGPRAARAEPRHAPVGRRDQLATQDASCMSRSWVDSRSPACGGCGTRRRVRDCSWVADGSPAHHARGDGATATRSSTRNAKDERRSGGRLRDNVRHACATDSVRFGTNGTRPGLR